MTPSDRWEGAPPLDLRQTETLSPPKTVKTMAYRVEHATCARARPRHLSRADGTRLRRRRARVDARHRRAARPRPGRARRRATAARARAGSGDPPGDGGGDSPRSTTATASQPQGREAVRP